MLEFQLFFFYITQFFLSKKKIAFLLDFLKILDIITIIPFYIKLIISDKILNFGFTRVFRLIRLVRAMRIVQIISHVKAENKEKGKKKLTIKIITTILTLYRLFFFQPE